MRPNNPRRYTTQRMSVRVRFAPSPTGLLHIGALRDALHKFLLSKNTGGTYILRIEDTDRTRYSPDSEQEFVTTLKWVGITFDEGPHIGGPNAPYRQSERKEAGIYAEQIEKLLANGTAYKAFDTSEELDQMREFQTINKQPTGYYGGDWRDASPEKVAAAEASGKPFVIRQRIPRDRQIVIQDLIRGRIEWDSNTIDDPVLIKADGMPTYHFASMVDDHLMGITHIMRGEEWISSAPKHAMLFESFGWTPPIFVHCPVIVGADGKKLSKRHGATRVLDYAALGFMPSPLKNFIANIGWSAKEDREVMTDEEMIQFFDLGGLQPSPGRFDLERLKWLSANYIRGMSPEECLDRLLEFINFPYTAEFWANFVDENPDESKRVDGKLVWQRLERIRDAAVTRRDYLIATIREEQPRVQTLVDFGEAVEFFLVDEPPMDPKAAQKWLTQPHVPALFDAILAGLDGVSGETSEYESLLKGLQEPLGLEKLGPIVHPVRVALTGKTFGPGLFELMSVLGKDRLRTRLTRERAKLATS